MFNLGQYLHQLLFIHQQVGVPGIGIISKIRIAAKFDESSNTFLPPTHTYALIQHATTDEYLIRHVAKVQHLSYESARQEVDKVIEQLLVEISDKGEARLDEIGYLKEAQGAYILLPFEQANWGLQPVEEYTAPAGSVASTAITEAETALPIDKVDPAPVSEDWVEEKKKKNNWFLWGSAALLLLVIAAFYLWDQQKARTTYSDPAVVTKSSNESTAADTARRISEASQDSALLAQEADSIQQHSAAPEKEEPLVRAASKQPPYTIVLASFKTMDLAIKQARYFRTIGINAFVLESNMPHNRKKICYGNYSTKEAAKEDLEKIRKEIDQAAYIYP